jgi:phosphomannomutase
MENIATELNELATGLLYLPKNHALNLPEPSGQLTFKEVVYDPGSVDEETLNYKFLMPAIEATKSEPADFIVGFSSDLKRIITAYVNPEGKFQAFNAHQQAALLAEFFLTTSFMAESPDAEQKLVVKSLLLSNQIDNIVKKNEGRIAYSHAGYESLMEVIKTNSSLATIAFDDRNTVIVNPEDIIENALGILDMLSQLFLGLKAKGQSLFDKHVSIQTRYNLYGEKTFNMVSESKKLFDKYRMHPPADLIHDELILITDYKKKVFSNLLTGRKGPTELEQMNLVQLDYTSGLRISVEYIEDQNRIVLHLSNYTHCYDKSRYAESRKAVHDRLLKTVVSLGKM